MAPPDRSHPGLNLQSLLRLAARPWKGAERAMIITPPPLAVTVPLRLCIPLTMRPLWQPRAVTAPSPRTGTASATGARGVRGHCYAGLPGRQARRKQRAATTLSLNIAVIPAVSDGPHPRRHKQQLHKFCLHLFA